MLCKQEGMDGVCASFYTVELPLLELLMTLALTRLRRHMMGTDRLEQAFLSVYAHLPDRMQPPCVLQIQRSDCYRYIMQGGIAVLDRRRSYDDSIPFG
jgi:hypothetical protein